MKEATGELNMTVVTIVAVAALLAFFYVVIWPSIKTGMALTSACNSAGTGEYKQTFDDGSSISCNNGTCEYTPANGQGSKTTKTCQ